MIPIEIRVDLHPAQYTIHSDQSRFKVVAAGRRFGKTMLATAECLSVAMAGGRAWWVSPNYRMSEVGWRPLRKSGAALGIQIKKVDREIIFPGGGIVAVRSADNPDSLRGEGLDYAVLDECAFMQQETWTEALRPALSDKLGKALFISTPKGRNWFWEHYQKGIAGEEGWASFTYPTSANPYILPSEIETARHDLPELIFQQEYLAEFLEGEGTVFRNIKACMTAQPSGKHKGHFIVAGVDWGKSNDFTAISVGCLDCHKELAIDRFNQIDFHFQRARLKALCDKWGVKSLLVERNSIGEPNLEELIRDGLPVRGFDTTASSKPPLIENLALALEKQEWAFISDPVWTGELEAYEQRVNVNTGRSTYSAPIGMHDDTVMARALMLRAAGRGRLILFEV